MRGDIPMIELLLAHGADPDARDRSYRATAAGWAEHHGHPEAQRLLEARQQRRPVTDRDGTGAAMRTVTAAFTAVSEGRFDELENLLADDLDWRGVPDEDGAIPSCHGRAVALERMRIGWAAHGEIGVSALLEEGDRVLAHVHRAQDAGPEPRERFVVAEVHDGQITRLCGYLTEDEAREALGEEPS
jgi:ketosteroid isomerase-like protein